MRPLEGVRVLDLTRLIPGPFGTLVLTELGAQVDKIEDAGLGDYLRYTQPQRAGTSVAFAALNRDKRSAVVNLKTDEGCGAFRRLVGQYDVLCEQFRPGVLDRLGVGHQTLRELHPRLVICALTGYGQTGPLAQRAGHDLNYLARSGILAAHGPADGPPQVPGFQLADVSGGMWCAIAILAALRRRDATGVGEICDIAMTDGVLGFATVQLTAALAGESVKRGGEILTGGLAAYGTYLAKDGVAMTLCALEPKFWLKFAAVTGVEADLDALIPGEHQLALRDKIAAVFADKTSEQWRALSAEHDFMVEPMVRPEEIASDPHLQARGLLFEQQIDGETVPMFRTPVADKDHIPSPAPKKGEHSRAIFSEAGFSADEIAQLMDCGAIA